MIKGCIYAVAMLLTLFLVIVVIEHFGYLPSAARAVLFWLYVVAFWVVVGYYVVVPLLRMNKLGRCISYESAARIIGEHFPNVKDKLLNLLQLQSMGSAVSDELLQASIRQKTNELKPVPFTNAINIAANRRYIKYAAVPLLAVLLLLIIVPSFITEPSQRIVNYTTYYERPAPFKFVVENESLETSQQSDFLLHVAIEGDVVPNEVFVVMEGRSYKMRMEDKSHFSYLFKTLQRSCDFVLQSGDVVSQAYRLQVFPNPTIANFQVLLSYPAYTGRAQEVLSNEGTFTVPVGTSIKWIFQTKDVDSLIFTADYGVEGKPHLVNRQQPDANGRLSVVHRAMQQFSYAFSVRNARVSSGDTLSYIVSVLDDALPMIAVMEAKDSTLESRCFFRGHIKDDYGFTKLEFRVLRIHSDDTVDVYSYPIGITGEPAQEFYYSFNLDDLAPAPGDHFKYFFEVWDNDAIYGAKSSRSQQFELVIPTDDELENLLERNTSEALEHAQNSMSELQKMQKDINEMMRKLVDKKELNWQDKKELQSLAEKQKAVRQMLEQMQEQLKENARLEQKYREQSEQLLEKQRELERLYNDVLNDEMKETMKEIEKLMQETDKKKVQEQLEQLKVNNDELQKQLDQDIELMKRLEAEKKVEAAIQKADKLAEEQNKLSKETAEKGAKDKEELLNKQQELSQQYQELKQEIKQIQQDYKALDPSSEFKMDNNLQQKIDESQQGAEKQLQKGKNKDASKQQKQAADDLESLSEQLAEAQMEMEQQELGEDAELVRQLLKNLVKLSFSQEQLIGEVSNTYIQDPLYQKIIGGQNRVKSDFRGVEDSLRAMAKRQIAVAAVINKELGDANANLTKSLSDLLAFNQSFYSNSKNTAAAKPMQYTMTSFNNLALVLAESLDKMQNQMRQNQQQKQKGSCKKQCNKPNSSCSKPGKGKPSPKSMKEMQDALNKQLESLKKQMDKSGKKEGNGRKRIGEKGSMSEEFAKMAAQQEMIRRMMQEYGQQLKEESGGNSKLAKEVDNLMRQMEQTETDLVNKTITQQTLQRQQQIMTRLLEHEKAEMQREKEERRESHEGKDIYQPSPSDLEKYKQLQQKNVELFRSLPPTLSNYYKNKVNDYFYKSSF